MLAHRTRAVLNVLFGRQYAGIQQDIDTNNTHSLDERAPVVITETKMESRIVVIPQPTTIVVTYHVPANGSLPTDSAPLPPASAAPGTDLTPLPNAEPATDGPQFASLIIPTSQETEPVPTTVAGGDVAPETSDANVNETTPPAETIAQPTSQEAPEAPEETPEEARLVDGQDSGSTTAPATAQPTSQETIKETPEEARLIIETDSASSSSSSSSSSPSSSESEVLLFDTASLTFTGPPLPSTTFQTRPAATTVTSADESTQSSDGLILDGSETANSDSLLSLTTATLADGVITTIGLDATAGSDHASETTGSDAVAVNKGSDNEGPPPAVVGSIVGSLMGIGFMAFVLFWLMRRRKLKRRRSTLLTPLGIPPGAPGSAEKYEIDNHSLGPTPRSAKVAAAMSANAKKIGRRFRQSMSDSANIDMNRGNSQFGSDASHSRGVSMARAPSSRVSSPPEGQQGWWSRLIEESSVENLAAAQAHPMPEKQHHDQYDGRRTPSPNPFSDANSMADVPRGNSLGRAPSPNPFSDVNSMAAVPHRNSLDYNNPSPRDSLVPSPLAPTRATRSDGPFSDENSTMGPEPVQLPPTVYTGQVEQRRGPSVARNLTPQAPNDNTNLAPPMYNQDWRGNVHSNPFDLELDGRHVPSMSDIQQMPRNTMASSVYSMPKRTTVRHSRAESYTSRYTSGVSSIGEWPPVPSHEHPPVPSIYGRYSGTDFPLPPRHSRSESDSMLRRPNPGQAM
ncbi:hypothetical protein FSARC_8980 [Fusarium sarcochroum]|uniref:Uncharacterized protein n=1 Tax=Fusarium sarcochroum TaxID=1208366 RepID=A0A8H4TSB7_9HYPO|nr:hypothetical protein FSARC_8980 [Fusarium sarcochroum]